MTLKRLFTEHPASVGESYFDHMRVALSFALPLGLAAGAALIHAFLPFVFHTTASTTVKRLHARMTNRRRPPVQETVPENGMPSWDPVI